MAGPIARIEGFKECREALQELSRTVQCNVGRRSLRAAADVWLGRQKASLPVSGRDTDPSRGSLKASPEMAKSRNERGGPRVALLIEDPAAAPGEFGTLKMQPHLKVRATTDSARDAMGAALGSALKVEVDAAARRAAKRAK